MDFLDEDAKPRFVLQSKTPEIQNSGAGKLSKPILASTIVLSTSLLIFSLFFLHSEPTKSLLLWLSLSLLLGPLAPPSLTAGDIKVGQGPEIHFPSDENSDNSAPPPEKKPRTFRSHRRTEDPAPVPPNPNPNPPRSAPKKENDQKEDEEVWEEKEWVGEEIEVLKKQLAKNPAGKPGRWESIAESFRGRHGVDSVIRKAKELGERKSGGGDSADSYSEFLRRRKPSDKKVSMDHDITEPDLEMAWSSAEDIALLNALKAFPKEAAMRWEKVAAALPGRSKAECVKRVADLKKGFRESKKNTSD